MRGGWIDFHALQIVSAQNNHIAFAICNDHGFSIEAFSDHGSFGGSVYAFLRKGNIFSGIREFTGLEFRSEGIRDLGILPFEGASKFRDIVSKKDSGVFSAFAGRIT